MQPETLNRSIQPTPTVHPRGFTPTCVQYWKAANIGFWDPIRSDERFTQLLDKMGLAAKARLPTRDLLLT